MEINKKTEVYLLPTFKNTRSLGRFSDKTQAYYTDECAVVFKKCKDKMIRIGEITNETGLREIIFTNTNQEFEFDKKQIRDGNGVLQDTYYIKNYKTYGFPCRKLDIDYIKI